MKATRVLITGGAGFIGTHLCRALAAAGHPTRVLDLKRPVAPISGVEYHQGDVRDAQAVRRVITGCRVVYHLAAIASVPLCQEQPLDTTQTNLASTALVLQAMDPGALFVFSSSSAVYGDAGLPEKPLSEDLPIRDLLSFYAAQKYGSELLIRQFHRSRSISAVVLRFFNVYGPGQDPKSPYTGVITAFSDAIASGQPIRLNGGGSQTRDFVSVHDIVRGLLLAMSSPKEARDGNPINLGAGKACSIRELGERMARLGGAGIPLQDAPWREGDVRHSLADTRRALDLLGWKPEIALDEGLRELLI